MPTVGRESCHIDGVRVRAAAQVGQEVRVHLHGGVVELQSPDAHVAIVAGCHDAILAALIRLEVHAHDCVHAVP